MKRNSFHVFGERQCQILKGEPSQVNLLYDITTKFCAGCSDVCPHRRMLGTSLESIVRPCLKQQNKYAEACWHRTNQLAFYLDFYLIFPISIFLEASEVVCLWSLKSATCWSLKMRQKTQDRSGKSPAPRLFQSLLIYKSRTKHCIDSQCLTTKTASALE